MDNQREQWENFWRATQIAANTIFVKSKETHTTAFDVILAFKSTDVDQVSRLNLILRKADEWKENEIAIKEAVEAIRKITLPFKHPMMDTQTLQYTDYTRGTFQGNRERHFHLIDVLLKHLLELTADQGHTATRINNKSNGFPYFQNTTHCPMSCYNVSHMRIFESSKDTGLAYPQQTTCKFKIIIAAQEIIPDIILAEKIHTMTITAIEDIKHHTNRAIADIETNTIQNRKRKQISFKTHGRCPECNTQGYYANPCSVCIDTGHIYL
jgi:hypothetical protein